MTVRFTCISLSIFFMAGRLDTVRFFRVQALQVVVNWFYSLRKPTIPVSALAHQSSVAGHTSFNFAVCWYGAGSRAGKGGGRQASLAAATAIQNAGPARITGFCFFKRTVFLSSKKTCNFLHGSVP
ncbi:hypothetical protein [Janthinobacterium sp. UMAB-56]|uniref:hypothetical protein n=1 Tax=Janthinobacterium sp. UMAB-56 TaxID=1365361 RepID=UPI001C559F2E|nr:hypothetical protein [Janthinobacterium sp. UMAB-56]